MNILRTLAFLSPWILLGAMSIYRGYMSNVLMIVWWLFASEFFGSVTLWWIHQIVWRFYAGPG